MPSLKEVRIRIASVKSTQQITSAMKMVAASKLRRAQNSILKMRPYAAKLVNILQHISQSLDNSNGENIYARDNAEENILIVALTSNRGLSGAFNSNIIKATIQLLTETYSRQYKSGNVSLWMIGNKGNDFFRKRGYKIVGENSTMLEHLTFEKASSVAESIMQDYAEKKYDKVILVYNQFKNAVNQIVTVEQFLPVLPPEEKKLQAEQKASHIDYIYLPSKEEIITELIPKTLKIQFYKALLDSVASSYGAQMTAMQQATDNAGELLKQLNLSYNKARQAAITKEILEIVSGAEALKNK